MIASENEPIECIESIEGRGSKMQRVGETRLLSASFSSLVESEGQRAISNVLSEPIFSMMFNI